MELLVKLPGMVERSRVPSAAALVCAVLALAVGPGAATAHADTLDDIAHEYSLGTSGGQVSNLTRQALQLRARGAQVSAAQDTALRAALDKRPNQMPLIKTLKSIVAAQTQYLQQAGGGRRGPAAVAPAPAPRAGLPPNMMPPAAGGPGGQQVINETIPIA